jgi:hypothetical protein
MTYVDGNRTVSSQSQPSQIEGGFEVAMNAGRLTDEQKRQIDEIVKSTIVGVAVSIANYTRGANDPRTMTAALHGAETIESMIQRGFGSARAAQDYALQAVTNPRNLAEAAASNADIAPEVAGAAAIIRSQLAIDWGR